jgi:hypothetical protein
MNRLTDKQKQWFWFALLWIGGIIAALLLSWAARLLISMGEKP